MLIGPWAVQDGLGIVLVRSFFRLAVWVRFFGPLGLVLGSFWGALGVVLEPLGVIFEPLGDHFWAAEVVLGSLAHRPYFASTHQPIHSFHHPIIPSTHPLIPSSHQPINPSTHPIIPSSRQPIHSSHHPINPSIHSIIPSTCQPPSRGHSAIDTPARRTARCAIRIRRVPLRAQRRVG